MKLKKEEFSKEKTATLKLKLKAKSGYSSDEEHKISPDQWARISFILNEPPNA